ncbi:MAG TPA: excinuclease ABC subunit UvrA [Capsulimonadaceae bacterium]|jgi:excinuclease ABC subunit A
MRSTIAIQGAREHNLKNISLEIPRDQLVVVTGVSGSGKSSLAFDTIYAEGQRRYMESLSSYARRFIDQTRKPAVDFMFGLSPVISIEQKTTGKNPRSSVGTLTDIASYLNLLFATIGKAKCPRCERPVPILTAPEVLERIFSLPEGTHVELIAPAWKIYGEDYDYLFTEIRKNGSRKVIINGERRDITETMEIDESTAPVIDIVVDKIVVLRGTEKSIKAAVESCLLAGERFLKFRIESSPDMKAARKALDSFGCSEHGFVMADLGPQHFMFNDPQSACRTCLGLGTYLQVYPDLLTPDKSRSIAGGAFVTEAFRYTRETGDGVMMHSLATKYGFSVDTPFKDLPPSVVDILLYGTKGEKVTQLRPDGAKSINEKWIGQEWRFDGIAGRIERQYRRYRQQQVAHGGMEAYLEKVMVEHRCPDCAGARVRSQRLRVTIDGRNVHQVGELNFGELKQFIANISKSASTIEAGRQVISEIEGRVDLLLGIGLDYLNFNRRSSTLSGGESQRIRLSTQIGSGLMGMLYVLDEPSIGLHPKDNVKMIATLRRLRDLGNTVIVVEHDEDTIRAADHVVEIGPGPGIHGGEVVVQGDFQTLLDHPTSLTGQYMSGKRVIEVPERRRALKDGALKIVGARENNLANIDVEIPLGVMVVVTGASGSGKSTLITDILFKKLYSMRYDSRVLAGEHDRLEGTELISDVVEIDQAPIGRNPRSNPATYLGFYDTIRQLFADTPLAVERGYTSSRFSFNVKGGRCETCQGDGTVTTHLHFMPDVEVTCEACKGARYNFETLEVLYRGKTIAEVLDMPIEIGVDFFRDVKPVARKLTVLDELGLGYITLGQSATTLSGGEAQRIKLAGELSKMKRGGHVLYILDEPTTGLHFADIERLLQCLNRLTDSGNSVLVIEHHMDVIKTADWIIDLGPEGGHNGGTIVCAGRPEEVARHPTSHTGRFLKPYLAKSAQV